MPKIDILVSVVGIVRDHVNILPAFIDETSKLLDRHYANYEIIVVDNGSIDDTNKVLQPLLGRYPCVRHLRLTRTTNDEIATIACLDAAIGDFVALLHPDFDPPSELISMIDECRNGIDLVLGADRQQQVKSRVHQFFQKLFRALALRLIEVDLQVNETGMRALSRHAVNALVTIRQRRRYFAVVAADIGLSTMAHPYDRISRSGALPSRPMLNSLRSWISILIHNSVVTLRIASLLGLSGSLLSFFFSFYVVVVYLLKSDVAPGWTTLGLTISGLFSLTFLILAIIGEYVGRALSESSDRPLYHLREERSSSVMLTNEDRRNVLDRSVESEESI